LSRTRWTEVRTGQFDVVGHADVADVAARAGINVSIDKAVIPGIPLAPASDIPAAYWELREKRRDGEFVYALGPRSKRSRLGPSGPRRDRRSRLGVSVRFSGGARR
jgi:hypothetical protein